MLRLIYLLLCCFNYGNLFICSKNLSFIDFSYMFKVLTAAKAKIEAYFE